MALRISRFGEVSFWQDMVINIWSAVNVAASSQNMIICSGALKLTRDCEGSVDTE